MLQIAGRNQLLEEEEVQFEMEEPELVEAQLLADLGGDTVLNLQLGCMHFADCLKHKT